MSWIAAHLYLVPLLPLAAAGLTAVCRRRHRGLAAGLAIGSMAGAFVLSVMALVSVLAGGGHGEATREVVNFVWFDVGGGGLPLGWVLDPLTAGMLVMVTFVGALIFIYSVGYMAHDDNFTRFFCFLSLFAAAMLGLVIANSLLLLFICWELVGLASYLLIGFWYRKPSAAAAAKKAFITTRVGDIGLFLGMIWLQAEAGTLLFYDAGQGCLEAGTIGRLAALTTAGGLGVATGIALLLFCGAAGKSGQVPLHVWLPDAMEGPTPVSALIHAATMVAAGVFLVARVYPLMAAGGEAGSGTALTVVTWVGAVTALFAACIAVAQTDIKRILAYSTVSQLGFMMLGLGTGGVAVGMFHLITHAFFKALLFLGSGSVIHGCHEEQDIRRMGGLRGRMPVTFVTYGVGMMALSGFPLLFSGFWSKDEILHAAAGWPGSRIPFYLGLCGALLTAFYMTRQMLYVFFGEYRGVARAGQGGHGHEPHESPGVMTWPLRVLAVFAVVLGFLGTPAWPWFHGFIEGHAAQVEVAALFHGGTLGVMALSTLVAAIGVMGAWFVYGNQPVGSAEDSDRLEDVAPGVFEALRRRLYVDELYEATVVRWHGVVARWCDGLDRILWAGCVQAVVFAGLGVSWVCRFVDEFVVNGGFRKACEGIRLGGLGLARLQDGQVQHALRVIGLALVVFVVILLWRSVS